MSDPPSRQVFLERQSYRRRRMMDAARLLPLLGAVLLAVPLLWPQPGPGSEAGVSYDSVPMSYAITYIFSVWAGLIALSVLFGLVSRHLARSDTPPSHQPGQD